MPATVLGRARRSGDQRQLRGAVQALDAGLLAHRRRGGRASRARAPARLAAARPCSGSPAPPVARQPALHVGAPARVQRTVAAAQHVHPRPPAIGAVPASAPAALAPRRAARRAAARARGSRTGAACIVRSRTSRQESPSLSSAGRPMISAVSDLDRLQHDAVGDRFGRGDVVGAGQHGHAGGLEDADVGRRGRDHRGDVDREQHGRRARRRRRSCRCRAPSAAASRTATEAPTRRAARCVARAAARGWRNTRRPRRRRTSAERRTAVSAACSARGSARPPRRGIEHRRERARPSSAAERREREQQQRRGRGRRASSTRESVTTPSTRQREQVQQRLRDHRPEHDRQRLPRAAQPAREDQRARGLAEARGQRRGHQHADEGALHRIAAFRAGARSERPRGSHARRSRARTSPRTSARRPAAIRPGLEATQRGGDTGHSDLLQREAPSAPPATRSSRAARRGAASAAGAPPRARRRRGPGRLQARQPLARGSRGSRSAGASP